MKTIKLTIHKDLQDLELTFNNGASFMRSFMSGEYRLFNFTPSDYDGEKIKNWLVKNSNDKHSNKGNWYAHCNGYAMGLMVSKINGKFIYQLNTYRHYSKGY